MRVKVSGGGSDELGVIYSTPNIRTEPEPPYNHVFRMSTVSAVLVHVKFDEVFVYYFLMLNQLMSCGTP